MERFSWRYWVSRLLMLIAVCIAVLVVLAPLTIYPSKQAAMKEAKVTSDMSAVWGIISELNALDMKDVNLSQEPLPVSEILPDYSFDEKNALLGGELFVLRDTHNETLYLMWSKENKSSFLQPRQAKRIDEGIDDGLPFSGRVVFEGDDICITEDQAYNMKVEKQCAYLVFDLSKFR